jgi:ureidoglycolate hydrolase
MRTIEAVPITKEEFSPYGRYYNLYEERKTVSEDFEAYMVRELPVDEPMNFGITVCKAGDFTSVSMERHFLTEEPQFCGDADMVLTVAAGNAENCPLAESVKAFLLKPGDLAVLYKETWHDANHGVDKDTMYYFLATNNPQDPRETEWVNISPEPVRVIVKGQNGGHYENKSDTCK